VELTDQAQAAAHDAAAVALHDAPAPARRLRAYDEQHDRLRVAGERQSAQLRTARRRNVQAGAIELTPEPGDARQQLAERWKPGFDQRTRPLRGGDARGRGVEAPTLLSWRSSAWRRLTFGVLGALTGSR
jgi:hypothetical protein